MNNFDLRSKTKPKNRPVQDCPEILGHPVVVILAVIVAAVIFLWGLWVLFDYWRSTNETSYLVLNRLWWQANVNLLMITFLALFVPWRLRCEVNAYSVIWVLLLLEYAAFVVCFPKSSAPNVVSKQEFAQLMQRVATLEKPALSG